MRVHHATQMQYVALTAALALTTAASAAAPDNACSTAAGYPCGLQVEAVGLAKAPPTFHLEARVSQAKLPVGEGLFKAVFVRVMDGNTELCLEAFQQVRVVNGIINLEIGQEISCDLNQVVGTHSGLSLMVCPGSLSTCLPAIPLASTSYAVKATWATTAERAWRVERVAQTTYAHRVAADDRVWKSTTIGTGYFDFTSPTANQASGLYTSGQFAPYAKGGFVQWTPMRNRAAKTLHIAGKEYGTDRLHGLDSAVLASRKTTVRGFTTVAPATPGLETLTVTGAGIHVAGVSSIGGTLLVSKGTTIDAGGLTITAGGLRVVGNSDVTGALTSAGALTVATGGIQVGAASDVSGSVTVGEGLVVHVGGLAVTGDGTVGGTFAANGSTTVADKLSVAGGVTFKGHVTFEVGHSEPDHGPDARYVLAEGETRNVTVGGVATIAAGATFGADLNLAGNMITGWQIPAAATAIVPCNATSGGAIFLNTTTGGLQTCISNEYRPLTFRICGDGLAVPGEGCDDGNVIPGDGCDASCVKE